MTLMYFLNKNAKLENMSAMYRRNKCTIFKLQIHVMPAENSKCPTSSPTLSLAGVINNSTQQDCETGTQCRVSSAGGFYAYLQLNCKSQCICQMQLAVFQPLHGKYKFLVKTRVFSQVVRAVDGLQVQNSKKSDGYFKGSIVEIVTVTSRMELTRGQYLLTGDVTSL